LRAQLASQQSGAGPSTTNIQTQNNNIQNNNQHVEIKPQTNINIQIHGIGYESEERAKAALLKMFGQHPHRLKRRLLNNPSGLINEVVKLVHFNLESPENWNLCQHKPSQKYLQVWNAESHEWDQRLRNEIYDSVVLNCVGLIEEVVGELQCGPDSVEDLVSTEPVQREVMRRLEEVILNGTRSVVQWVVDHQDEAPEAWRQLAADKRLCKT
jgi:hypothetical protein